MPTHIDSLTYLIPEDLEPRTVRGSLVDIRIRGTATTAVVLRVHNEPASHLTISPLVGTHGITLPESSMQALEQASAYFAVSIPYLADALIPSPPKRWKGTVPPPRASETPWSRECRLIEPNALTTIVRETVKRGFAVQILAPTLAAAEELGRNCRAYGRTALVTSEKAAGALWTTFTDGLKGDIDILVTTRRGILFPLTRRGRFIILQEEHADHKQWDMKPRYDARTLCEMIARAEGSGLIIASVAPRLTTLAKCSVQDSLPVIPELTLHVNPNPKDGLTQPTEDLIEDAEDHNNIVLRLDEFWNLDEQRKAIGQADLIIAQYPDRILATHEWNAEERLHGQMLTLMSFMKPNAKLVILAMSAHRAFAGLLPARRKAYAEKLLDERRALHYPPFGSFVKLIAQSMSSMTDAKAIILKLSDTLRSPSVECLGPYEANPPIVRGRHRALMLLHGSPEAIEAIKPALKRLHDDILVDIDPEAIFR